MAMMDCSVDGQSITWDGSKELNCVAQEPNSCYTDLVYRPQPNTLWDYWSGWYYPQVIKESYPVYIRERASDEGKKAFEIIKMLQDKKIIKFDKVKDFVEAMDALIKIL